MGNGEQVQGMGKYKMGTKLNLNPSPIPILCFVPIFHFPILCSFPTAHYPLK